MVKTPISYVEYQRLELIVPPELNRNGTSLIQRIWQFMTTTSRDWEPRVWCSYDPAKARAAQLQDEQSTKFLNQRCEFGLSGVTTDDE